MQENPISTFLERIGIFWNGLQIRIPWHRFPIPRKNFRLKYWKMKKLGEEYKFQSQSNLDNFYFAPNFFIFQYFNLKFFLGIGNRCQGIRICNPLQNIPILPKKVQKMWKWDFLAWAHHFFSLQFKSPYLAGEIAKSPEILQTHFYIFLVHVCKIW
jgi:hypothetical protein